MALAADAGQAGAQPQHLPIIDLSAPDERAVAQQLLQAATEWGFVYIRGRGLDIDAERLDGIFDLVRFPLVPPRLGPEGPQILIQAGAD